MDDAFDGFRTDRPQPYDGAVLLRLNERINDGASLDAVLDLLYDEMTAVVSCDRMCVAVIDQATGSVIARWCRSNRPTQLRQGYSESLGDSHLREVVDTGRPKIIDDLEVRSNSKSAAGPTRLILREGMRSSLTCPLIVRDRSIGFMFFSSTSPKAYSGVDTTMFEQVAGLIATTMERDELTARVALSETEIDDQKIELKEARREIDRFFDMSLDLLSVAGTDGYFKVVNPSFERVLGYTAAELLTRPLIEFVHPDDRQATLDETDKLKQGRSSIAFENRYRCKDGSYRWLEWTARPMAEEGEIYSVARDNTAHKELDLKLMTIVESAPVAMILIDPDDNIALANRYANVLFGYRRGELAGQPVQRLIPKRFKKNYRRLSARKPAGTRRRRFGSGGNLFGLRKDGAEFPVEIVATAIDLGRTFLMATVTDMTERKKASARVETIFESSPDGILLVGSDGKIGLANAAVERIFGYEPGRLVGRPVELLVPKRIRATHGNHRRSFARTKSERPMGETPFELFGLHSDGSEVPVDISLKPIEMDDGDYVITTIRDLTERRRLQREFYVARQIQQALLPKTMPSLPGFDVAADLRSAEATGGDFFQFNQSADGSHVIAVGDVSGHGFGPAILTAGVMSYIRAFLRTERELSAVLSRTNRLLHAETRPEDFATAILVRLAPETRAVEYASAAHPYGFLFDQEAEVKVQFDKTGLPLGMFDHATYSAGAGVTLDPGDTLVLATDGIIEALSPEEREFGFEGISNAVRSVVGNSAAEITESIYQAVADFTQTTTPVDDMTVLVIRAI
jgi:PAS domain S-box-containing protein